MPRKRLAERDITSLIERDGWPEDSLILEIGMAW